MFTRRSPAVRVTRSARLVLLCLLAFPLPAADAKETLDWEAWRALKERFVDAIEQPGGAEEAIAAAREIVADGGERATKVLLSCMKQIIAREDKERARAEKLAEGILKNRWTKEIHAELGAARAAASEAKRLAEGIADAIGAGDPSMHDAFRAAAEKVKDKRWHGLAARIHSFTPERHDAIVWLYSVSRDADPLVRARILEAVAPRAGDWPELIAQRAADRNWAIQTRAARLAKEHKIRHALGAMIGQLSCAAPRAQLQIADTLEDLTGNDGWGVDPRRWSFWWQQNRNRFGKQTSSGVGQTCPEREYVTFYDMTIRSDRLLLVVDVSGSMIHNAIESYDRHGRPIRSDYRRIDLVKRQLKRTIEELPRGVKFNMLAFGHKVRAWDKDLVAMDAKNRRRAKRWVERLKPDRDSGTRMNGALHAVFGSLGFGDCTRCPVKADTIVLLTDGAPTDGWPSGRGKKGRAAVLDQVRTWNRSKLIVIHTVALRGATEDFLKTMAEENGGRATVR